MRFRRTAVPVTECAAAGVLCLVHCLFGPHGNIAACVKKKNLDILHTEDKKNYEDETRHPSTGGTDGGAGC